MLLEIKIISDLFCYITKMLYICSVIIICMVQIYKKYRT